MAKQTKRNGTATVDSKEARQHVPLGPDQILSGCPKCEAYGVPIVRTDYGVRVTDAAFDDLVHSLNSDTQKIFMDCFGVNTRDSAGWYPVDVERALYNMERVMAGKPEDNSGWD